MIRPKNIVIIGGGSGIGLATAKKSVDGFHCKKCNYFF